MFLLQYTILTCLITAMVHSFATEDIQSDVNGVRVHHIRTILLREETTTTVRDADLDGVTAPVPVVKDAQQHTITAQTTVEESGTELEYAKLCDINVFLGLDDLVDALQILKQGLAINEKVHGKEHLATAACYNNIGAVMKAMGDNYEALQILSQALATFEKAYGMEHPATATAYTNIGSVMQAMGNNVGALEMYNRGLAIREKVYGKEHPDTAESYSNIWLLYQAMGNTVDALKMPNQDLVVSRLRVRRT